MKGNIIKQNHIMALFYKTRGIMYNEVEKLHQQPDDQRCCDTLGPATDGSLQGDQAAGKK